MTEVDDVLRSFRAGAPGPADGDRDRIMERAQRVGGGAGAPPPPRRRLFTRERWKVPALAVTGLAGAAVVAGLVLTGGEGGSPAPGVLTRAEAALTKPHEIFAASIRIRQTTTLPNFEPRDVTVRQWNLAGAGKASKARILITQGPIDQPPTDQDGTVVLDRDGQQLDARTWRRPWRRRCGTRISRGRCAGRLEVGAPKDAKGPKSPLSLVDQIRQEKAWLRPAGKTPNGDLRLRGEFISPAKDGFPRVCFRKEVILDPRTYIPRSIDQVDGEQSCRVGAPKTIHEIWTIEAKYIPATPANRRLLEIGDWPTPRAAKYVRQNGRGWVFRPIDKDEIPPVPPLDEDKAPGRG